MTWSIGSQVGHKPGSLGCVSLMWLACQLAGGATALVSSFLSNRDFTVWNTIFKLCIDLNSIAVSMRESSRLREASGSILCRPGFPLTSSWCGDVVFATLPPEYKCVHTVFTQAKNQPTECFTCSSCGGQDVVTVLFCSILVFCCSYGSGLRKKYHQAAYQICPATCESAARAWSIKRKARRDPSRACGPRSKENISYVARPTLISRDI